MYIHIYIYIYIAVGAPPMKMEVTAVEVMAVKFGGDDGSGGDGRRTY